MKTWKLTITEEELKALISYHHNAAAAAAAYAVLSHTEAKFDSERSKRIHDLTKRLNEEKAETDKDTATNDKPDAGASAETSGW